MKFFQRALDGSRSYCECVRERATYFQNADGNFRPIGELLDTNVNNDMVSNSRVVRLSIPSSNESLPEPLLMPTMNFKPEDDQLTQNVSEHLPMPKLNFEKKGKDKKVRQNDDVLLLPAMQF